MSCAVVGPTPSTYTYGADGLRRSAKVNGTTSYNVYDRQMLTEALLGETKRINPAKF